MKTDHSDTSWARAWLPPLMTAMVDRQLVDSPADREGDAPATWPCCSPYPFDTAAATSGLRPRRAVVDMLRTYLAERRVKRQATM